MGYSRMNVMVGSGQMLLKDVKRNCNDFVFGRSSQTWQNASVFCRLLVSFSILGKALEQVTAI